MTKSVIITGRQVALSVVELESLYGADNLSITGSTAVTINLSPNKIEFNRLGGAMKLGKVLTELPFNNWSKIKDYLINNITNFLATMPNGKIKFGISCYDTDVSPAAINATALAIKKQAKAANHSMRVIPNKQTTLNSAQVLNNKLTDNELGLELLVIKNKKATIIAQTIAVQDIDAYAARDQARPKRDAKVGMLPPKLAQTIINLAHPASPENKTLLDPFCGTGVLLQEALLMGFNVIGSDIDKRMIEYSKINLEWLHNYQYYNASVSLEQADACDLSLSPAVNTIACETYLGRPFSVEPKSEILRDVVQDVNTIHKKFLKNITQQIKSDMRLCLAVPAWFTSRGIIHLPVLDQLTDMGYTRMSFVHTDNKDLIYHREGQIVGRELVILIRK